MSFKRSKPIPKEKIVLVKSLADSMKKYRTVLIASCKGLPSSQFHSIKKSLRGTADITMVKKNAAIRAIEATGNKALEDLKKQLTADVAFFFSNLDAFTLSGMLTDNQIPSKARAGDIAPEDLEIQPGPTDLVPGPAISELSGVGLKVAVKEGKLEIIKGAVVAKKGDAIKENVAAVLGKLGISPMRVGFIPVAAYDNNDQKVYVGIKIDKQATLEELRDLVKKALGFAVSVKYPTEQTVRYFIAKASIEEKALSQRLTTTKEDA